MKFVTSIARPGRATAFSIVEAIVGTGVVGIMFVSLYAGLASGFSTIRMARENLRATQVILEKMETIRLYTWEQLTETNFLPTNFTATYYPPGSTNSAGTGPTYFGTLTITQVNFGTTYDDELAVVTVSVTWDTAGVNRTRSLSTYVSPFGLQNYIW